MIGLHGVCRFALRGIVAAVLVMQPGFLPAQESGGGPFPLRGRVVDASTGLGIDGADVVVIGGRQRTVTGADGDWELTLVEPGRVLVRIRHPGYAFRDITLQAPAGVVTPVLITLEPRIVSLEAVVVTAARREQRLKDAVVETELVTRAEIERSGAADVAGALSGRTGIQLEGGVPAGAGVQLQGLGAQRVLVLLDGQPLVGRVNGNFDLSRLPASLIERIEVVKGPQSTLYGSDAMGGVINVLTRTGQGTSAGHSATLLAGTSGRKEASATISASTGRTSFAAEGGLRTVDLAPGVSSDAGTVARRWHFAPRAEWRADSALRFSITGLVIGETQRYRTGQLFRFADNVQQSASLKAAWRRGAHRVEPLLFVSRFEHLSRASTAPEPASDSGARDVQQLIEGEATWHGPVAGAFVDAGIEARQEAINAERVSGGRRTIGSLEPFAQATWFWRGLSMTPGARVVWNERWGTSVTPRLAVLLRPRPELALRAALGRAYRAPDFKELYLDFVNASAGYAVVGNPNLTPETSTSLSGGVEWSLERAYLRAGAFTNRFRDFIETGEPDVSGTYTYRNIAGGSTSGLELEAALIRGAARLEAGYSWQRAVDRGTGGRLLGRPAHSGRASLAAPLARRVNGSLVMTLTGNTPVARDTSGVITRTRGEFVRLDARVAVGLPGALDLAVGADNLLDRSAGPDWPGFTGRQAWLSVTWRGGAR